MTATTKPRVVQVAVRLPESLVVEYRHLAVDLRVTQATVIETLLREALNARAEARWAKCQP